MDKHQPDVCIFFYEEDTKKEASTTPAKTESDVKKAIKPLAVPLPGTTEKKDETLDVVAGLGFDQIYNSPNHSQKCSRLD